MLDISGQVGVTPEGTLPADFYSQYKQALLNVEAVLHEANMTFADILKMSFFLARPEDMDSLFEVRREFLDGVRPAITTLSVAGLVSPDWLVEMVACAEVAALERRLLLRATPSNTPKDQPLLQLLATDIVLTLRYTVTYEMPFLWYKMIAISKLWPMSASCVSSLN